MLNFPWKLNMKVWSKCSQSETKIVPVKMHWLDIVEVKYAVIEIKSSGHGQILK